MAPRARAQVWLAIPGLTDPVMAGSQVSSPMKVNIQISFEGGKKDKRTLMVGQNACLLGNPKGNILLNAYCSWKDTSSK